MYLNFAAVPGNTDDSYVNKIHYAMCFEWPNLIASGIMSTLDLDPVFSRFFDPKTEGNDNSQTNVEALFSIMYSINNGPKPLMTSLTFDNNDFNCWCPETQATGCTPGTGSGDNGSDEEDAEAPEVEAYLDTDTDNDGLTKIHFCNSAYSLPRLATEQCGNLDSFPSEKMDSFARILLHETLHWDQVGPMTSLGHLVVDQKNEDGLDAYFASRTHGLLDPAQDSQPGKCDSNADSLAWMATVRTCNPYPEILRKNAGLATRCCVRRQFSPCTSMRSIEAHANKPATECLLEPKLSVSWHDWAKQWLLRRPT